MIQTVLGANEAAQHLVDAGFVGYQVAVMTAVGFAESGLYPYATHVVINPESKAHLSIDLGVWQANSYWVPRLLDQLGEPVTADQWGPMVFDPATNAKLARLNWRDAFERAEGNWAMKAVAGYSRWTTYAPKQPADPEAPRVTPPYKMYLPAGIAAAKAVGA